MGKLGNILAMLKILESGRKYTVNELAKRIEVSPRMIKSYKAELEKAGIYVDSITGVYGGYVYGQKNNYDVSFSVKDVNCLEKILPTLDVNNKKEVELLLEKIKIIVIYSNDNVTLEKDLVDLKAKYNVISKAIKNGTGIVVKYKNKNVTIKPHNVSFYKDCVYFTGYSFSI